MKKLFVSLMTALVIGTSSLSFAAPSNDTTPVAASVVVWAQTMKLDVITQASDESPVVIRLRDANGNILVKKSISKGESALRSRFDLSDLKDGEYQVEISEGTSKMVKSFTIETTPPTFTSLRSVSLS
jgi:hypothetical protein